MNQLSFEDFLEAVPNKDVAFVTSLHEELMKQGCTYECKLAKSGYTLTYYTPTCHRALATYIFRKTGMKLRMYPQHLHQYEAYLDDLPDKMKKEIKKASVCKRMIDPSTCNQKCVMGYDFYMDQEHYQKCRYMAFQPNLSEENDPYIMMILKKELSCR